MANYEDFRDAPTPVNLEPCGNCGRTFNPDVLIKHSKICSSMKKRKVFDASKQRLEGMEGIEAGPNKKSAPPKVTSRRITTNPSRPKKDWRQKHQELISTIRSARNVTAAVKAGAPLPPPLPPSYDPDLVQCPYCNRRFNETAAERHMGFCKEKNARIGMANSKAAVAKEKLSKRTQYKPPLPGAKKTTPGQIPQKTQGVTPTRRTASESPKLRRRGTDEIINYKQEESYSQRRVKSPSPIPRKTVVVSKRQDVEFENDTLSERQRVPRSKFDTMGGIKGESRDRKSPNLNQSSSRKGSGRDPQWFEDLKRERTPTPTDPFKEESYSRGGRSEAGSGRTRRAGSGKTSERPDSFFDLNDAPRQRRLPREDPDLNDNFSKPKSKSHTAVGVVKPSSRQDSALFNDFEERTPSGRQKLATYCHECGTKYPVPKAKFCCECGMKRMCIEC